MKFTVPIFLLGALLLRPIGTRAQSDICGVAAPLLSCGATVSGNTSVFTADANTACGTAVNGTGGGVWYRILGTGANITASLCASSYNTAIRIFTGPCVPAMICVAGNDDFCGVQSQVTWLAAAGTNYYILVHGNGAAAGIYSLDISCAPSMDTCNPTMPVVTCGSVVTGNTTGFASDVAPACGPVTSTPAGGVWYMYTGTGATVTASLCGSAYDTAIRVFTGTCAALTCVVGNGDFCGQQSQVTWASTLGTPYYILITGFGSSVGAYTLTITCVALPPGMCYAISSTMFVADPHAGTAVTLGDDQHSAVVNIGFSFCYNGTSYTQAVISSNNYISFNTAVGGTFSPWVTVAVPNTAPTEIRNSVLGPWQDLYPPACAAGCIRYQTLGSAPNRRFVVSYLDVPMFSCTLLKFTSQMVLYEGSNCFGTFLQTKPVCATWNGGNAVHGLHNGAGTQATVVAGRNNTQWIATNEGRFFSPTCAPCSTAATVSCAIPTPVELLYFQAHRAPVGNTIEWATASELNTDHFTVERSEDGAQFAPLMTVSAAGNSNATISYVRTDEAPLHGVNYYRLRATDLDGSEEFSDVISVNSLAVDHIAVYPNPVAGSPGYQLPVGLTYPTAIIIRDLAGRSIKRLMVNDPEGILDVSGLATGSYFLEVPALGPETAVRFVIE